MNEFAYLTQLGSPLKCPSICYHLSSRNCFRQESNLYIISERITIIVFKNYSFVYDLGTTSNFINSLVSLLDRPILFLVRHLVSYLFFVFQYCERIVRRPDKNILYQYGNT